MTEGEIVHDVEIRVRYADTDKMGIVYNGNYLRYFEVGRTELLRSIGVPYASLEHDGFQLPVLEAHVEYVRPARYDDLLLVQTTYAHRHSPVIELAYTVLLNGDTLARGYTRHSFVDARSFKPVRPPRIFVHAVDQALSTS